MSEMIQRDPFTTGRRRFRHTADLALDVLSDERLNFWAWRIETELEFIAQHQGREIAEVPSAQLRQELRDLLKRWAALTRKGEDIARRMGQEMPRMPGEKS